MLKIAGLPIEIVILRCPYKNLDDPTTRDLFSKMMYLKYKGYNNRHNEGTLPLDSTDYVADHPLICVRNEFNELIPIVGSKVINYETCKYFNMDFALESCFKKNNSTIHMSALYKAIEDSKTRNHTIAYHGGYTIDSSIVKTSEDRALARELFMGITTLYFQENKISELLGFGVPKYKTEFFFYQWGYERCTDNGNELAPFPVYFLPGADGILMHLKEFSSEILDISHKYKFIWKQRTEIGTFGPISKEKIQAA